MRSSRVMGKFRGVVKMGASSPRERRHNWPGAIVIEAEGSPPFRLVFGTARGNVHGTMLAEDCSSWVGLVFIDACNHHVPASPYALGINMGIAFIDSCNRERTN